MFSVSTKAFYTATSGAQKRRRIHKERETVAPLSGAPPSAAPPPPLLLATKNEDIVRCWPPACPASSSGQ